MTSPPPTSQEFSVKAENFSTRGSDTSTSNETTLSTFAEQHKDTRSFDIFDSDDHDTFGNGRRHSVNSQDESILMGNGLASPRHCSVSPSPDGHLVTPAPKKIASLLTPPPSDEKTSVTSISLEEIAPDVSSSEKNLFTLPHEENPNGDFRTLEHGDISALSHAQSHSGDVAPFEEGGHSTLPQSNLNGDIHTSEQNHLSTPLHEGNHSDGVTQFEENDYCTLPHENCDGAAHTLEQDNLSTVSREGNYNGDGGAGFEESGYSALPRENYGGDVHTWEQGNLSIASREGSYNGDGAEFEENGYSALPYDNYDSDVRTPEPKDLSTLPQENSNGGVSPLEENCHYTLPHKKESHYGDAHTSDKTLREPSDASKIANIKEQNSGRQPRGDYWRPSITESRAHTRYGDSYRGRETRGSNHQFRSSVRHLGERDRRPRSRSPARDIKRGRFRDLSPPRRGSGSRDGPYGLSGSNASHQTEDRSGWHRFGNQTFKGDRYIPLPEPTRPARRSPAPSPGRELTPPRRTLRNRSRSRSPPPTLPRRQSGRQPEYTSSKVHPTRSSSALPDQSAAFQNSIRSANTGRRNGAASAFEGGHSAGVRNSNYVQARIPTSPKRPEKRRHEDEPPAQNKRSRRDEPAYNGGRRDYRAPRSYGSR